MPIRERQIKVTLDPPRRGRVEMIRALMAQQWDGEFSPTWNDVFAFLIDIAPVDEWMRQQLNGANQQQGETNVERNDEYATKRTEQQPAPDGDGIKSTRRRGRPKRQDANVGAA